MPTNNIFELKKLLHSENPDKENIYTIIGRMEVLLDFLKNNHNYNHLIPFLETYLLVTIAVAEKYTLKKHYFQDFKSLERLDVYFASLYFNPLLNYLEKGTITKPWETYFSYIKQKDNIALLQIMLGINAHINADLFSSIKKLKYSSEKDFFIVNDILMEVIPDVMKILIKKHDLAGLSGIFFSDLINSEFHNIIEKWRSEAWLNYKLNINEELIIESTEKIGKEMTEIISSMYKSKNPLRLKELNSLSVSI